MPGSSSLERLDRWLRNEVGKMKPSIIFRISRFIHFVLKGIGKKETEHYLFTLSSPPKDIEIYQLLADYSWQPNYAGYGYKGQVWQCRKLVDKGKRQKHVRIYDTGRVTGHLEIAPEFDASDHLSGVDLRTMNEAEVDSLVLELSPLSISDRRLVK